MGVVLSQLNEEGLEHPICYSSRSCNSAEQNYSSFDGKCLAVVWATNHFCPYLFGNTFTLVTNHEPLQWLMTTQKLTGKMARWSLLLQEYDFTVQHRAGTENANADCLSRYPLTSEAGAPILEWSRGEVLSVASYLACMAAVGSPLPRKEEAKEIWEDVEVLRILQTHKYGCGLGDKDRDRVYRRAQGYR